MELLVIAAIVLVVGGFVFFGMKDNGKDNGDDLGGDSSVSGPTGDSSGSPGKQRMK